MMHPKLWRRIDRNAGEFQCFSHEYSIVNYTVSQKNPCDYVFNDNLNSKRPIVIIFGTVIT